MAWIEQVSEEEAQGTLERIYQAAHERTGGVANIIRVMSRRPSLLQTFLGFYVQLMQGKSTLPSWERELLATVTSSINDCHY